ncbi:MAG: MBOAT family protein [Fibromonadaceae bacterium]|nr:MBOAT family protein [Fibromonadaceae bacterium]
MISWFVYNPKSPLLFSSSLFMGLFLVFYLIYICTYEFNRFRTIYVLLFSFFFYYKAGGMYFILLIVSSVLNYFLSNFLHKAEAPKQRKIYVTLLIAINLGILAYYKYTNFIIGNINAIFNGDISFQNIILPIGISFFLFQAISYAIDVYRRQIEPAKNLLDFSFYLCFFPQLVAGPIVRAKEFLPQMYKKLNLTKEEMGKALFLIMVGLIKKSVISDYISLNFVDRVFSAPNSYTAIENLLAAYGYSIQIYCDFSGYSDMAIGLALLMGFKLPTNFLTPYKSKSVTEFWKRWHISLSSWLRDYLYISLGGNRKGKVRTYINLFLTMLIGGLWHGAAWRFVVWGALHGVALAVERLLKPYVKIPQNIYTHIISVILTFHFVTFAWIFFRARDFSTAMELIGKVSELSFKAAHWLSVVSVYKNVLIVLLAGFIMHFLPDKFVQRLQELFTATHFAVKALVIGLVLWLVYATASSEIQPFIYFQF